jgi:hypothetical protein
MKKRYTQTTRQLPGVLQFSYRSDQNKQQNTIFDAGLLRISGLYMQFAVTMREVRH